MKDTVLLSSCSLSPKSQVQLQAILLVLFIFREIPISKQYDMNIDVGI